MLVREEEAGLETEGEGRPEVPEVRRGGPLNRIPEKRGNTSNGWWRVELELDKSQMRSSSSEPLAGAEVKREVPPDPDSKMLRGSTSLGEGKVGCH